MLSKKDIQLIRSLTIKKYRQKYHKYFAEGEKICLEIIKYSTEQIEKLYCLQEFLNKHGELIDQNAIDFELIEVSELKKISQLKTPNLALALLKMPDIPLPESIESDRHVVFLDDVRDPGNLGTILRSADWFGIDRIILSPQCVDIYNPKVVQSTMGSLFRLQYLVMDLDEYLQSAGEEFHIYFAEMSGSNAFQTSYQKPLILVLGNESKGITLNLSNRRINSISIPGKGRDTESLNVAVAGSILIAEITK